jgi:hypothetical protein
LIKPVNLDLTFSAKWRLEVVQAVRQEQPGFIAIKLLFSLSLMMRPNTLEGLSLETLSSQVLGFEAKARANPIRAPFRCFLLG